MSVPYNLNRNSFTACILLCVLVLLVSISGGCVNKILQKDTRAESSETVGYGNSTDLAGTPGTEQRSPAVIPAVPVAKITPVKSEIVTEVAPYITPDPYPVMHATRINETPVYRFIDREPEFEKKYVMRGNATGFLVNVVEGPLYIVYSVKPQNDCLFDPETCRGGQTKPVQRPYLTITVRDNATQEVVTEDGYGRQYSSDTGDYNFVVQGENDDGLTSSGGMSGSNSVSPGLRRIIIYREGIFHVTMEGNYLDVNLAIITGTSPDQLEINSEKKAGVPSLTKPLPEEEGEWG